MKFVIAAGGTGGHLFPGLAVGEVLLKRGHEVMIIVSEKEIDAIATSGRSEFRIEKVVGVGLQRKSPVGLLQFARKFYAGFRQCRELFTKFQSDAVLGMGGFTSLAPILAGRRRKVSTFVHESNAIPGKANRLNARFCTAVLLGFGECAQHFPKSKCIVTGTPVRQTLAERVDRALALAEFSLQADRKTVLVMGGSQGAHGINTAFTKALETLKSLPIQVIHFTGREDEILVRDAYSDAGIPAFVAAFWHRMEVAYSAADFAVARSGAASLTELSRFSLPSLLIPYPYAAEDHQTLNAKIFERAGAAVLLTEREITPDLLAEKLRLFLDDPAQLSEMSARSAALAPRDAAERVADVVLAHCTNSS
jgi:UDP-N-acetylglucosamine--N-acetylmuramyl-(pentapeptide) pyrophosphoryl-undecaprenol N-acetylglucosamine transferase